MNLLSIKYLFIVHTVGQMPPWYFKKQDFSIDQPEVARLLYEEYQADLNTRGLNGVTAIWFAAARGDYSEVEMLAGWGADLEIKDVSGFTPVRVAARYGNTSVVQLLIRLGAKK